jgi:energy-coupling factor transporter ATP-binding protein EcfA2
MSIDKELLAFASSRAPWLRDCLRRICIQADLTPTDFQEVFANLKSTEGLAQAGVIQHLDVSHLASRTVVSRASTVLTSISDVKNINRLAPSQTLLFAERGITLIYGYNGSGKTGYARILKQVCRSRHEKQDPILGDVYIAGTTAPASARIDYKTDGTPRISVWIDGSNSPDELSLISVFDATTAPLYADKQNKIEFLPMGLDVLPRLGKICEQLTVEIDAQIRAVDAKIAVPLPKVESISFIQFLGRLSGNTTASQLPTEADVKTLFTWTAGDDDALDAVQAETRKLSEPAAQSGHLARLIGTLLGFKPKIESAFAALGHEALAEAKQKVGNAKGAREAATIAADGRFTNDPLGEAPTTAAWRKLFESAEAFSAEVYPDEVFPVTGIGRVCLLCQQSIGEAAQDRFSRFKDFLRDTTQKDALRAEQEVAALVRALSDITIPAPTDIDQLFKELTDTKPAQITLRDTIKQQCVALAALKSELLRCLNREAEFDKLPTVEPALLSEIDVVVSSLNAEKQSFDDQTKDTTALTKLRSQRIELIDRKNCAGNLAIFITRRNDLCTREAWKKCRDQCETNSTSRKSSQLRDAYLTQGFQQAVLTEVRNLGLDYLPLKVEGRTERGVGYIGVALSKTGREPTSRILSEGEFRGLALACFFAEIGSIAGHDGIVVDDPVSSLDHLHVEQVARRLVDEARVRPQVIVFTHDLAFYYDLWTAAAEAGIAVHRNWIHKDGTSGFGHVTSGDGPWQVKKTDERIKMLRAMVSALPDQASTPPAEWQQETEEFYSKLRETWERLVEECLLNKVVGRFQPGVSTQSLKGVSVTDEDYKKVFFAMKKASEFSGHDRPAGRPPVTRSKAEMDNDVAEIWAYERELKKRTTALENLRKALENPPVATVTPPQVV